MKKIISLIFILLFALSLTSCKDSSTTKEAHSKTTLSGENEQIEEQKPALLNKASSITPSNASGGMYLNAVGMKQGKINGECKDNGDKKDTIALVDFNEGLSVPIDDETGLPIGMRKFETVSFVHKLDCSSPSLRKALSTGEQLNLTIDFYRIKSDGMEEKYFSITYENAILVSIEIFTSERNTHYEEVSFTFSNVVYVYNDGNISFTDRK